MSCNYLNSLNSLNYLNYLNTLNNLIYGKVTKKNLKS